MVLALRSILNALLSALNFLGLPVSLGAGWVLTTVLYGSGPWFIAVWFIAASVIATVILLLVKLRG